MSRAATPLPLPVPLPAGPAPWHHAAYTLAAPVPLSRVLSPDVLLSALLRTCAHAEAQVEGHLLHRFEPQGASVVLFGPWLRLVLHTWPEHGLVTLDVTCAHERAERLLAALDTALGLHVLERHRATR